MLATSPNNPLRIALPGASGRMGQTIMRMVATMDDVVIVTATDRPDSDFINVDMSVLMTRTPGNKSGVSISGDAHDLVKADPHAIIDFTTAEASVIHAEIAAEAGIPIVIGTTGHDKTQLKKLQTLAEKIPLVICANGSMGVNIVFMFAERMANLLPAKNWDIEIAEVHHKHKIDAPSGTALAIGRAVAKGRGVNLDDVADYARHGMTGAREAGNIGFAVRRGGDVVGEHSVVFYGDGEEIELRHRATDRKVFAAGALVIAGEIVGAKAGFYEAADVLENMVTQNHAAKK